MKTLITDQKDRVALWVAQQLGGASTWSGAFNAIGVEHGGDLVAGVVVDRWIPGARCEVHLAGLGKTWINRGFMRAIADYCYTQLQCKVVIAVIAASNTASQKFTKHVGFTEVCRIADAAPDGDLVMFALPRSNCRWMNLAVR